MSGLSMVEQYTGVRIFDLDLSQLSASTLLIASRVCPEVAQSDAESDWVVFPGAYSVPGNIIAA